MKPWNKKRIALDFDDTFTLSTDLWSTFVMSAARQDFEVRFVTFREAGGPNDDIKYWSEELGIPVIFCNSRQKAQVCAEMGWIPDVWIDDMPVLIPMKQQLQGMILGIERNEERNHDKIEQAPLSSAV